MERIAECANLIRNADQILCLTGAGMSTESGVPDFRSDTGLYTKDFAGYRPETVLSRSFFFAHPDMFWKYISLHLNYTDIQPNIGHTILAKWGQTKNLTIVTQNIDELHADAGSKNIIEIHGSIKTCTCQACGKNHPEQDVLEKGCLCACGGLIKPDVVLYEESVDRMDEVYPLIETGDLLLVLGTSLTVFPVAAIPQLFTQYQQKPIVIINQTPTPFTGAPNCIEIHASIGETLRAIDSSIPNCV